MLSNLKLAINVKSFQKYCMIQLHDTGISSVSSNALAQMHY